MRFRFAALLTFLICGDVSFGLRAESTLLDSVSQVLQSPSGVIIDLTIKQTQYGDEWTGQGTFKILSSEHYIFDSPDQWIRVHNDTIITWNKLHGQVVLDLLINDDFQLFDLLSGHYENVTVTEIKTQARETAIHFQIGILDLKGTLWISSENLEPRRCFLTYGTHSEVQISFNSIIPLENTIYEDPFDRTIMEVIDLRE